MSEVKVDWSLAPKDATEIVKVALAGQKWRNPETKQYWSMNGDFGGYYSENSPIDEGVIFATRPQQKTVADANQEGEKWTHTHDGLFGKSVKCKVLAEYKDRCWVLSDGVGVPDSMHKEDLKLIKPKLTKEAAWLKMQSLIPKHGVTSAYTMVKRDYDITD